jgi:DNA-3-methyladenine glycosylase I
MTTDAHPRCPWVPPGDELYVDYHDTEWGVPVHDDARHFEKITLEGAQSGLSWRTILVRREGYRTAFAGFDPAIVATFGPDDIDRLVADASIIRHRGKIESTVHNASAFLTTQAEFGSFDSYIWEWVDHRPRVNHFRVIDDYPAQTQLSVDISKDLKRRGFRFVGPTTVYSYLQSFGLVMDHTVDCFRHAELSA